VFAFFGIKASRCAAEARLIEAEEKKKAKAKAKEAVEGKANKTAKESAVPRGANTTGALKKKKRRGGGYGRAMKHPCVLEMLLNGSPLRSKGDSEEAADPSDDDAAPDKTPTAPTPRPLSV
jgi:hypothetical protein